jgi:hypothetical protein
MGGPGAPECEIMIAIAGTSEAATHARDAAATLIDTAIG